MPTAGFIDHIIELLAPLGRVSARRMFGGHGVYCDGLFIAIVLDDALYLKTDAVSRAEFEHAGCEIFSYSRKGKVATLNFHRAPEDAMDAPQRMLPWAKKALEAALRARTKPRARAGGRRKTAARGGRSGTPRRKR